MKAPLKAPGLTLTREMKLVLILLLMVALIGGWFVLTNRSTPDPVAVTPAAQPEAGQPASGTTGESTQTGETGTGAAATTTPLATGGQIEVATLPPFPVPDTATSAAVTPTPGGINPDQSLLTLGTSNPFRPLQLAPTEGGTPAGAQSAGSQTASQPAESQATGTQATGPITVPEQTAAVASVPAQTAPVRVTPIPATREPVAANPVGGAVPITRLPGTGSSTGRVVATVSPISGGALPTVTIPGANAGTRPANAANGAAVTSNPATSRPTTNPAATTPATTAPAATPEPIVPPIAGVTAPRETGTGSASVTAQNGAQTGSAQAAAGNSESATTSAPQVITQLGQGNPTGAADAAVTSTAPAATTTALDRVLADRGVNLDAAVLGPVNTAVFRTDDGFVVVSVGQTLLDTDVVLRSVTATTATLVLGNTVKTLQLEQR
jgi:hypothetical protein